MAIFRKIRSICGTKIIIPLKFAIIDGAILFAIFGIICMLTLTYDEVPFYIYIFVFIGLNAINLLVLIKHATLIVKKE